MIICLDNHVLLWGIKEDCTEGQEEMIPRTKTFIDSIGNDASVIVHAIVVGEFLMRIPKELHAMVINLFNKNFIIAPYDALCASKYATIWKANKPPEEAEQLIKLGATRAELKADSMIVATAVARKADCIYSTDKWIKTFAQGFVDVKGIPFIEKQSTVFPPNLQDNWGKLPANADKPSTLKS